MVSTVNEIQAIEKSFSPRVKGYPHWFFNQFSRLHTIALEYLASNLVFDLTTFTQIMVNHRKGDITNGQTDKQTKKLKHLVGEPI